MQCSTRLSWYIVLGHSVLRQLRRVAISGLCFFLLPDFYTSFAFSYHHMAFTSVEILFMHSCPTLGISVLPSSQHWKKPASSNGILSLWLPCCIHHGEKPSEMQRDEKFARALVVVLEDKGLFPR